MGEDYDVLVVGSRVAGSSLAILLGELGHRVLLVDRARFPSPTLSTHFFRGSGLVSMLERLRVLDEVLALGSPPLTCEYWYLQGAGRPSVEDPQHRGKMGYSLSVRRETLDGILVERARREPGIEVRENTRLLDLMMRDGRPVGARLATGHSVEEVRARFVIGADGRHSTLARLVDAAHDISEPVIRAIQYCYVTGFEKPPDHDADGPEFSIIDDEIAYVFPSDQGVACLALSVNIADFDHDWKDAQSHFSSRLARHAGLDDRYRASTQISKVMGMSRDGNFVRAAAGPGWALVGDAGIHQDPWSGWGMDLASIHAAILAESLDETLSGRIDEATAIQRYAARRNEHAMPIYASTQKLGRDLRQMVL
jgi:menaquinone-9 beta-reductase